jgi:hypothetical protein
MGNMLLGTLGVFLFIGFLMLTPLIEPWVSTIITILRGDKRDLRVHGNLCKQDLLWEDHVWGATSPKNQSKSPKDVGKKEYDLYEKRFGWNPKMENPKE